MYIFNQQKTFLVYKIDLIQKIKRTNIGFRKIKLYFIWTEFFYKFESCFLQIKVLFNVCFNLKL